MPGYVGDKGEARLAEWCADVRITPNPVRKDRTGWDYLLEFPFEIGASLSTRPLDLQPQPLQCLVQVKSSDSRRRSWGITLSNWDRLVKSPFPAFFLVLEYDRRPNPQRAYLVHIGEQLIYQVLQRERQLQVAEITKLHKIRLSFRYEKADALDSLDGFGLEQAIRKHVPNPRDYEEWKVHTRDSVGYDGHRVHIEVSVRSPEADAPASPEEVIDFALGIIPFLELPRAEWKDVRFGIPIPLPEFGPREGGRLELCSLESEGESLVTIRTVDGSREVRLKMETIFPRGFLQIVPEEYWKIRLRSPLIETLLWTSQGRFSCKGVLPPAREVHALTALHAPASLILLLNHAHQTSQQCTADIEFQGTTLARSTIEAGSEQRPELIAAADAVECAYTVARYLELEQDVCLSIEDLLQQEGALKLISSLVSHGPRVAARVIFHSLHEYDLAETYGVPRAVGLKLGSFVVLFAIAVVGKLIARDSVADGGREYDLPTHDVRLIHRRILVSFNGFDNAEHEMIRLAADYIEGEGIHVILPSE